MAWVAVDKNGDEGIFDFEPYRRNNFFWSRYFGITYTFQKGQLRNLLVET